jgi:hypothetical protein
MAVACYLSRSMAQKWVASTQAMLRSGQGWPHSTWLAPPVLMESHRCPTALRAWKSGAGGRFPPCRRSIFSLAVKRHFEPPAWYISIFWPLARHANFTFHPIASICCGSSPKR